MYEVIQVKLREAGKISLYDTSGLKLEVGSFVIVETERGPDYGEVVSEPEMILDSDVGEPLKKIKRITSREDLSHIQENKKKSKDAFNICTKKIRQHRLDMKLVEVEHSFDRSKIVFYFTAEGRVDFRELVKDLAKTFRAKIELKQIGVRDEAKMLGGFGHCGRQLCCARFLKEFEPVTIRMAKEQKLPLNPTKISGLCGRLMCCLGYEYQNYKELLKNLPKEGQQINTKEGKGKVVAVNPLKRSVIVEIEEGREIEVPFK